MFICPVFAAPLEALSEDGSMTLIFIGIRQVFSFESGKPTFGRCNSVI